MKQPLMAFLITIVVCTTCYTQNDASREIDVNTDVDVTVVYEQVVEEGYGTSFIYKELAVAYYFKNDHANAKKWFEKLFEIEGTNDATLRFRYNQTLKALDVLKLNDYDSSSLGERN